MSERFYYKLRVKLVDIVSSVTFVMVGQALFDSEPFNFNLVLLSIMLMSGLLFLTCYKYLLNEYLEVDTKGIKKRRRIGRSSCLPFSELRRLVIRDEMDSKNRVMRQMTVFGQSSNMKIKVSDLKDADRFINLVKTAAQKHYVKFLRQDASGQIVKAVALGSISRNDS